jgi:hypothetical protein
MPLRVATAVYPMALSEMRLSGAAELDGILDHLGWKAVAVI